MTSMRSLAETNREDLLRYLADMTEAANKAEDALVDAQLERDENYLKSGASGTTSCRVGIHRAADHRGAAGGA